MTGSVFFHACKALRLNLKAMAKKPSYGKVHKGRLPQGNIKYPLVLQDKHNHHSEPKVQLFHLYPFDMAYSLALAPVQQLLQSLYGPINTSGRGLPHEHFFCFQQQAHQQAFL